MMLARRLLQRPQLQQLRQTAAVLPPPPAAAVRPAPPALELRGLTAPPCRGICSLSPLLRGGAAAPQAMSAVRGGGGAAAVVAAPLRSYRSASGTAKLKAKLKAKHRRSKGAAAVTLLLRAPR
jgi:hypothetical protein